MKVKNKMLIIHQGAIGDLITSLPAFYTIRRTFPKYHFEVMGYPEILSLIHKRFYADSISSVNRAVVASLYIENAIIDSDLLEFLDQFHAIFIFGGKFQKTVVKNIARNKGPQVFWIPPFPENVHEHVIDFQLRKLCTLGFIARVRSPRIFLLQEDRIKAVEFLSGKGVFLTSESIIAIHTGSGDKNKNWPVENFLCLMDTLYNLLRSKFLLIEGPVEKEAVEQLEVELSHKPVIFLRTLPLPILAAIINECTLFIGNDAGITHIAASLGIPTIAIFGPTNPHIWGPRGDRVTILRGENRKGVWEWPSLDRVYRMAISIIKDIEAGKSA